MQQFDGQNGIDANNETDGIEGDGTGNPDSTETND